MDYTINVGEVLFNYRAGLIIKNKNKVFIEKGDSNSVIPGGRVKTFETSYEALLREMKEEMGIDFKDENIKLKSIINNLFIYKGKKVHELFFVYQLDVKDDDKRFVDGMKNLDSDTNYYEWSNIKEFDKNNLLPEVLKDIVRSKKMLIIKNDDINKLIINEN